MTPHFSEREYYSFHKNKGHKTAHCKSLWWYLEELVRQDFFKEYVLTPRATFSTGQLSALPPTEQSIQSLSTKQLSDPIPPPKTEEYFKPITLPLFSLKLVHFILNQ